MSKLRVAPMKTLSRGPARVVLLALCLLSSTHGAWAACTRAPSFTERFINMDMGRVIIPPNTAVGARLADKTFPIPIKGGGVEELMYNCTFNQGVATGVMLQGALVLGGEPHIFSTAVTGVGIRLSRVISSTNTVYYPHVLPISTSTTVLVNYSQFKVELFKTGPATGNGPLAAGTYTRYYGDGDPSMSAITTFLNGNGITIITPSCTVDTGSRNISVPLGKVARSRFEGVGTTAGDKPFKIQLNCQPGQNAQNFIYLRMDAQQDPATTAPGVLKITGGTGIAGGVGIQVLDAKAAPVTFGGEVLVGPSKDGAYVLPYTARYYQTGSAVTAGRADGTATFTLSYK
ncbi:fimbrial protein [Variovorax sp. M-6]|uniref:fimbrial protein n=1 Tax=Variovorax sp. M-6 TaxID=3233041 RepID=UPI003F9A2FA6